MYLKVKRLDLSNCWDCGMQQSGYCTWFKRRRKIPLDIVDKGCNHYRQRTVTDVKADIMVNKLVNTFNGTIADS